MLPPVQTLLVSYQYEFPNIMDSFLHFALLPLFTDSVQDGEARDLDSSRILRGLCALTRSMADCKDLLGSYLPVTEMVDQAGTHKVILPPSSML